MPSERDIALRLPQRAGDSFEYLRGSICLALLVTQKWDRALDRHRGPLPTPEQVAVFDTPTAIELENMQEQASRLLANYAATLPRSGDKWHRGFWQGFAASWAYAFSIALVALRV